jgi:hypothetical protein
LDQLCRDDSGGDPDWIESPFWKNRLLHEWRAQFAGAPVDGIHVGHGATMQFQQIYRDDFAERWSTFALRGIRDGAGVRPTGVPDRSLEAHALAVCTEYGIDHRSLTAEQKAEWLTPREAVELAPAEALVRILVRGYSPPRGIFDLVTAEPELVTDPAARTAVAESAVVNAEIAGWSPRQGIEYLRSDLLRSHLREVWHADGEPALLAAARDRGFGSVSEAVDAVRPFFLRRNLAALDPARSAGEPG